MKSILIIVDPQNDFIRGSLGSQEAQTAVPKIVELIKSKDWDWVFVTQDTHCPDHYLETEEGKRLPIPHCLEKTEGWEIDETILEALGDIENLTFLEKPTFGTFELPYYIGQILNSGDDNPRNTEIVFCGFCTDICVITNVLLLKTAFPESARFVVCRDCCSGLNHESALDVMKSCQVDIW